MITTINEFKKLLNENNSSLTFDIGPGGSSKDIMNDWNLIAKENDGEITIYGSDEEIYNFADDYGLLHLLNNFNEALNTDEDDVDLSKELKDKLYIGDFH